MSDNTLSDTPHPTSTGRKLRIKRRSGDIRLDAVEWEKLIPDYWIANLKDAIKSIVYNWITEVHNLLSYYNSESTCQQRTYIDRSYQQLEYGIRDLWGCWKSFEERTAIKVSHIELMDSPVYSRLGWYHSFMVSLPGCDARYREVWEVRANCRRICISLDRLRSGIEEVVMRVLDRRSNESWGCEWTDEEIRRVLQGPFYVDPLPALSNELLEFLGEPSCL